MDGLGDEYRRTIVRHLDEARTPTSVSSLAVAVAREATEPDQPRQFDDLRNQVQTELQHTHLPKLDEFDVIEYDRSNRLVEPGPFFDTAIGILADLS